MQVDVHNAASGDPSASLVESVDSALARVRAEIARCERWAKYLGRGFWVIAALVSLSRTFSLPTTGPFLGAIGIGGVVAGAVALYLSRLRVPRLTGRVQGIEKILASLRRRDSLNEANLRAVLPAVAIHWLGRYDGRPRASLL